jgi:hypothetical protein
MTKYESVSWTEKQSVERFLCSKDYRAASSKYMMHNAQCTLELPVAALLLQAIAKRQTQKPNPHARRKTLDLQSPFLTFDNHFVTMSLRSQTNPNTSTWKRYW